MSDVGAPANVASASQISRPWLRDAVIAYDVVVRPTTILLGGLAVFLAALHEPASVEVVGLAAALAGGVALFKSLDKQAAIGKGAGQ